MKILHVITDLKTGGAEKLMVDLLPKLKDADNEVELCVFNGEHTPFFEQMCLNGIKIHSFGQKSNYYSAAHIIKLINLARKFDIIHTHNTSPQLFGAIAGMFAHRKWITTEHTTTSHRRVWWYKPIERWMYGRYDRIICISEAAKDAVIAISKCKNDKISVVPNGIDLGRFINAASIDKTTIGRNESNKKVILMVGRYSYQKDQATIIRAMAVIPDNVELWLVGYGETQKALSNLIEELNLSDRVFLLGARSDIPQLLKASDIVVQSSHIEGFGMAAVEAMASGKPVVASDVSGLRDVVGGAGLLFEHNNHKQLANKIISLLNDDALCRDLVSKGFVRANGFSIQRMTENYSKLYKQLNIK